MKGAKQHSNVAMPGLHAASSLLFKNEAEDIRAMSAAAGFSATSTGSVAAVRAWGLSALERRGVKIKSSVVVGAFAEELNDLTAYAVAKEAAKAAEDAEVTAHLKSFGSDRLRLAAANDPQIKVIAHRAAALRRGGTRGRAAPKAAAAAKKLGKLKKKVAEQLNRAINRGGASRARPGFRFARDSEKKEIVRRMALWKSEGAQNKGVWIRDLIDEYARNTKAGGEFGRKRIDDKVQISKSAIYGWKLEAKVRARTHTHINTLSTHTHNTPPLTPPLTYPLSESSGGGRRAPVQKPWRAGAVHCHGRRVHPEEGPRCQDGYRESMGHFELDSGALCDEDEKQKHCGGAH